MNTTTRNSLKPMIQQIDQLIQKSKSKELIDLALDFKHIAHRTHLLNERVKTLEKCYRNILTLDDVKNYYRTGSGLNQMKEDMAAFSRMYFKGFTGYDSEKLYILHCFTQKILKDGKA